MSDQTDNPTAANGNAPGSAPAPSPKKMRIGDLLVEQGLISQEQLNEALAQQKATGKLLGEMLVEQKIISASMLVKTLGRTLGVQGCQLRHGLIDPAVLNLLSAEDRERLKVIPMFKVHDTLTIAMAEPQSLPTVDRIKTLTGLKVRPVLALEEEIAEYTKKYASGDVDVDAFMTSLVESDVEVVEKEAVDDGPATDLDKMVDGSPIVNLVNVALLTAIRDRASDVHVEPDKRKTRIRYRIDGVLRDLMQPPPGIHGAIVSRIKIMAKMDIAEKRLPQEGRIRLIAEGREIDLRVSSMPTLLGEKMVIRILDKENLHVRMEDLGFRTESLDAFKDVVQRPHGLVLVTGPTGSGKTTTLYSVLDLLRSPERNIVTVEDPVEYQLDLINQIQVQESIGMSFARALRSILRQDPDIIMVGEIRDQDTARVAVQAALTGHLVLATLHTNDAPGAVSRLIDMGIEPYLLSGALNGVIAQRLARTVCPACATKYYPAEHVLEDAGLTDEAGRSFRKGSGCQQCHDTGFQGRLGIYEVMAVSPAIRRMVHRAAPSHEIREQFTRDGGLTLRDEGVLLAKEGKTSLEEILRVTHDDEMDSEDEITVTPGKAAETDTPAEAA